MCAAVSRYRATACSARRFCRWRWQRWQHRWSEPAPRLNVGSHYAAQYLVLCAAVGIVRPRVQHGVFAGPRRPAVRGEHRGRGRQRSLAMPPEENLEIKEGPRAATALGAAGSGTALGRTKSRKRGSQAHKGSPIDSSPLVRTRARAAYLPSQAPQSALPAPALSGSPPDNGGVSAAHLAAGAAVVSHGTCCSHHATSGDRRSGVRGGRAVS